MTDKEKLEAIRAEILHRLVHANGYSKEMANELFAFMNSLPGEPVGEDLLDEIHNRWEDDPHTKWPKCPYKDFKNIACHFANWQKEQLINKACEWLKALNNEHEIISFTDCHGVETEELIQYFKNFMED